MLPNQMEQRVMIRFFTPKRRQTKDVYTELESAHGPELLGLSTTKKGL
jgi:hypothetical protein